MQELKRILWNRRPLFLFGLCLLLHSVFFILQCNDAKSNTLQGEELAEYVSSYGDYVQSVQENALQMEENPLFSDRESFVYRNLIKTGEDYARLSGLRPVAGENRGIVTLLNFSLTNFVTLLAGLYIVFNFMAERRNGLYLLVRSTERGRLLLSLQRIGILAFGILAAVAVLYGSALFLSARIFPGCDLTRPVQSIPEFGSVIGRYSIGTYMLLFLWKKAVACMLSCLLLYFCMSVFRTSFCTMVYFLFFAGEYALYSLIIPTSKWCVFKYLNLYTYVFCGTDYAKYYNMNLSGRPVPIVRGADFLIFLWAAAMLLLCLARYARQYPKSSYKPLGVVEAARAFLSRHKPSYPLFFWELKKVMVSQKGLLLFAVLFYLALSASLESHYYVGAQSKYVTCWYQEYHGTITEEMIRSIRVKKVWLENDKEIWENRIVELEEMLIRYQLEGKGTGSIQSSLAWGIQHVKERRQEIAGISIVLTQAEGGYAYNLEKGGDVELIDPMVWDLLFYDDRRTILRNYLYALLTVVMMTSGMMACERAAHMETLLHSFYKGRKHVLFRKIAIMVGISIICTLPIHLIQYFQIGEVFPYTDFGVKIQSVPRMRFFPLPVTIQHYLVLLYAFRTMFSVALGGVTLWLSNKFSRTATITIGVFLIILLIGLVALRF